jgi:NAD(P)-dependent dehydrogenase (short-subunit alcohol dehydrogenase family)
MTNEVDAVPVAVVTGAGHGIGRAVARRLLADGFLVAAVDIDVEGARETIAGHEGARAIRADIAEPEDVRAAVATAVDVFGRVDVHHLNAGVISSLTPFPDVPLDELDRVLAVNVRGTFVGVQEALRQFRRQGTQGAIVITSSIHGIRAADDLVAYQLSKGALDAMVRAAAMYGAPLGIRVNGVAPGVVPTARDPGVRDDMRARSAAVPARRAGTEEEIAAVVAFLVSSEASYVHGQVVPVDGGASIVNTIRPSGGAGAWRPPDPGA